MTAPERGDGLLVLVGLTGVGKTTLVRHVLEELDLEPLPGRRELADRVAIPAAQRDLGEAVAPVRDRRERFRLTAHYRSLHPGGMAEALAERLGAEAPDGPGAGAARAGAAPGGGPSVDREHEAPPRRLFDNLRGTDEVGWALAHLPAARFLMLDAPEAVRVERLLGRRSAFDRVDGNPEPGIAAASAALELAPAELARLRDGADPDALAAALAIVAEERRNYDGAATAALLREHPERALVLATDRHGPDAVARAALAWLRSGRDAERGP